MLKRLSIYSVTLLLVPFFAFVSGWHWQPDHVVGGWDYGLFLITETAGKPFAIVTCGAFALFYLVLVKNKKRAVAAIIVMALALGITQGIKSVLKPALKADRPFVTAMLAAKTLPKADFYLHSRKVRGELVKHYYNGTNTPQWLVEHRAQETSFSLPSGHSLFAAMWVMLAVGFAMLLRNRYLAYFSYGVTAWAILVLTSRLVLGMHSPADLALAIGTAWLVAVLLFSFLPRLNFFNITDNA